MPHKSPFKHFGARNPFCDLQHVVIAKKNPEELQGLHLMQFKIEQICKGKSATVSAHWACLVSALFHPSLICVTNICIFCCSSLYQEACDPEACWILNQNTSIFLFEFYKLPFVQTEENVSRIKIGLWGCFGVWASLPLMQRLVGPLAYLLAL